MVNNLTRVHGHDNYNNSLKENTPQNTISNFVEKGVFISVIADKNKGSVVHFDLINETSYQLLTTLKTNLKGIYTVKFIGEIKPQSTLKIYSASLAEMYLWPQFHFQTLFYTSADKPIIK